MRKTYNLQYYALQSVKASGVNVTGITFWGTVDLNNLIKFLELRDSEHAQEEIREYAVAIKQLIKPIVPHVAEVLKW